MSKYRFYLALCTLLVIQSEWLYCQGTKTKAKAPVEFPDSKKFIHKKLTFKITAAQHNTFCYDIYADGKLLIHQSSIPAVSGDIGFKSKDKAASVAKLVIQKIKKGEMPPTVSKEELRKLNAL